MFIIYPVIQVPILTLHELTSYLYPEFTQWLEICASPHEFQVNKGKSFSLTGVGCLRTTEDLYSETMRMETA